ncbi:MAG: filamentous hemagglutinin N-terminal domain-containing protein, partial [Gammaproteobacteria bacterium]|nr:filamentous hemagglutinin N-terminal domain-containing protein [Gammaproteobacteria bacterium]
MQMSAIKRHVIKPLAAAIRYARLPLASLATLTLLPGTAGAGPQGEQIIAGAVTVARPDTNTTRVTQGGDKAIVNWNSFSVGGQEYVQFVQPGSTSAILNRVVGGHASQILGHLNANGRVFLVNPQGVYFGAGAKVDTAGLVASVLDINDQDFMDSRYVFTKGTGAAEAEVRNSGEIHTSQFAVLIGDRVANEGLIEARLGTVALGAGSKVSLSLDQTGLVNFAVDEKTLARHAGVENTGTLLANGGRVLLTAKVADDLLATAVNNTGVIRAQGITERNGEIILSATGGDVVNRGMLDASGPTGGQVLVSATHDVEIANTAQVLAEGAGAGRGGSVRLIAEHSLAVRDGARVATRGGEAGGKGGLVELSAHHGGLEVAAHAVTVGSGGRLVIDPARFLIASSGSSITSSITGEGSNVYVGKGYIETQLNGGGSLDLIASFSVGAVAANHVDTALPFTISASGPGDLHIKLGTSYSGTSFLRGSYGDIQLGLVSIDIGGSFLALAGSGTTGQVLLGGVKANSIRIEAGGTVVATALTATGGSVLVAGSDITVNGSVQAGGDGLVQVQLNAAGDVTLGGNITVEAGGAASLDISGDVVSLQGATVTAGGADSSASIYITAHSGISVAGNLSALTAGSGDASIDLYNSAAGGGITVSGTLGASGGGDASIYIYANQGDVTLGGDITVLGQGGSASLYISGDAVSLQGATVTAQGSSDNSASIYIQARNGISVVGNLTAQQLNSADYGSASIYLYNGSSGTGNITVTGNLLALTSGFGDATIGLYNYAAGGGITVTGTLGASGGGDASIDITAAQGDVTLGGDITVSGQGGSASLYVSGDVVSMKGATVTAGGADSSASIYITAHSGISVAGDLTAQQTNTGGSSLAMARITLANSGSSFAPATGDITVAGNLSALTAGSGDASIDLYNSAAGGGITVSGT